MATRERPLSPHLQVYRWQITMAMSILHRATGVALAFGAFGVAWWLHAVASGGESYECFIAFAGSLPGKAVFFAASAALSYHLFNGIRHLAWDSGRGYDIPSVYKSGYTVAALAILSTAAIWFFALAGGAA